jgi:hypothetical protein
MTQTTRLLRLGAGAIAALLVAAAGSAWSQSAQFERPPTVSASQVLPPDLLRSPYYSIGDRVTVDGFQYAYQVQTKNGVFTVKGTDLLRVRAREIAATAKLAEISGGDTLVESAGRTAMKPVETAKDLVTAPGQTISDTFKGVGHIFGSVDASMKATDPHKEGVLASVTGGSTARRKLAFDLGVDPHTSFEPLDAELTRLATASAIGETGVNAGLSFVAGPAGFAISASGTSNTLRAALRDKTAAELEKDGRQVLASMGVSDETVGAFYANPMLTPTDKAIIVEALASLGGAGGSELFVAGAAKAPSIEMGFFYRRQAELIAAFNKRVAPVRAFVRVGGAPMLETGHGLVSVLPVDYLAWTPPLGQLASGANAGKGGAQAEMWITGRASEAATTHLADLGWKLVPKAGAQLGQ